jgi:hypothetical protein
MGGLCPSGMAVTVCVDVEAPSETVWAVLTDFDALPSILTTVSDVKRINGDSFEIGTKIRETRVCDGHEYTLRRSVTGITKNPRSLSFNTDYGGNKDHPNIQDICNTSTLTVLPVNDVSCTLMGTFAVASPGLFCSRFFFCLMAHCGEQQTRQMFSVDLEEYAAAAIARVSKQAQ